MKTALAIWISFIPPGGTCMKLGGCERSCIKASQGRTCVESAKSQRWVRVPRWQSPKLCSKLRERLKCPCSPDGLYTTASVSSGFVMATKRTAEIDLPIRPIKKHQRRLSQLVWEMLKVQPQANLLTLVKEQLSDVGSFRPMFQQVLQIVSPTLVCKDEIAQLVKRNPYQRSIDRLAEKYQACCEQYDAEKQVEHRNDIVDMMESWLQQLFQIAILWGLELYSVQKSLIFMEERLLEVMKDNSYTCYQNSCYECLITSTGSIVYHSSPHAVLQCFWRDLLLMATVQNDKAVLSQFKAHAATNVEDGLTHSLSEIVGPDHKPGYTMHLQREREEFFDSWHTADMKAAAPRLLASLQE